MPVGAHEAGAPAAGHCGADTGGPESGTARGRGPPVSGDNREGASPGVCRREAGLWGGAYVHVPGPARHPMRATPCVLRRTPTGGRWSLLQRVRRPVWT